MRDPCPIQFPGFVSRPSGPNVYLPDCAFACVPRYRGLRIHRRVIDNTRFFLRPGMPGRNILHFGEGKRWCFLAPEISDPQLIDVHGPHPVIIGPVTALVTDIPVPGMVPVFFTDPPAFWASLRGISSADPHDFRTRLMGFVCKVLLQLVERP